MHITDSLIGRVARHYNNQHLRFEFDFSAQPQPVPGRKYFLYIHIPFCEYLCPFCSFHRVKFNATRVDQYFAALQQEIELYHQLGFDFEDVYFGGGTPTVVPEALADIIELLRKRFSIGQVSVETNPNHLTDETLATLQATSVNRLSVGVQSLDDDLLKEMGRYQPYGSAAEIRAGLSRAQGRFDTFNVDMMFNFPHQSRESVCADIQQLKSLGVDQVSFYPLMPADVTERAMDKKLGRFDFVRERQLYELIQSSMTPDYHPVSAWCFANKPASIDEYIVDHDEYVGMGSGAFSYINGSIFASSFSLNKYIDMVGMGKLPLTAKRQLTEAEQARYDFLIKLFGGQLDKALLRERYGDAYRRHLWKELLGFRLLGALEETEAGYRVTESGRYYWVLMMREFFIGVNNFRAQMRKFIHDESDQLVCYLDPH